MIFRELSNAVFRFVLRCAGAEIDGGGVFKHPPPSRSWKIQRPSRARVNKFPWGGVELDFFSVLVGLAFQLINISGITNLSCLLVIFINNQVIKASCITFSVLKDRLGDTLYSMGAAVAPSILNSASSVLILHPQCFYTKASQNG